MSANCCNHEPPQETNQRYRKILWIALVVNFTMFGVEIIAGIQAGSASLLADSLDFLGDAANYGISLWVLNMSLVTRAKASLLKAASMGLFGIFVLANAVWSAVIGTLPNATTMSVVGVIALFANVGVAILLYSYRNGDSNMRSVWLCTRNDALGNIAVIIAAVAVVGTGRAWPDLIVAAVMAVLALSSSWQVMRHARSELIASAQKCEEEH
jgi:cation diffusion facilitator family transporter